MPADGIRVGDCLGLEEGDRIAAAAAATLTEAVGLGLDESLLTGESISERFASQPRLRGSSVPPA